MYFYLIVNILVIIITSVMILVTEPINSVLSLCVILLFSTGLLLAVHVEYLSYIFIMIYVGGIALLFLFVIIMLNLKGLDKKGSKRSNNLLIRAFFIFLSAVTFQNFFYIHINKSTYNKELPLNKFFIKEFFNEDIVVFEILYTHYFFYLILAGIVLLASMVGVILLTLNTNAPSKVRYKKII